MYCLVEMTALRVSPFTLTLGTLVTAELRAHNSRGWSVLSSPNVAGPTIETEPSAMAAPTQGSATNQA